MAAKSALFAIVNSTPWRPNPGPRRAPLVEALLDFNDQRLGWIGIYNGDRFLAYPDGPSWFHYPVQSRPEEPPFPHLRSVIQAGAAIVPELVACLGDERPVALEAVYGQSTGCSDGFDVNRRTEPKPARLVNGRAECAATVKAAALHRLKPREMMLGELYQVRLGDLCYLALGQIVNRSFQPVQQTAGLLSSDLSISSPATSWTLRDLIVARYQDQTPERHEAQLVRDFLEPDADSRFIGAAIRLSLYYPETLERLALQYLKRSTYDTTLVLSYRDAIYKASEAGKRKALCQTLLAEVGSTARAGLEQVLFDDLLQTEWHAGMPTKDQLVELFGVPPAVGKTDRRDVEVVSDERMAEFVTILRKHPSPHLDTAILRLMYTTPSPKVALACMAQLEAHGYHRAVTNVARKWLQAHVVTDEQVQQAMKLDSRALRGSLGMKRCPREGGEGCPAGDELAPNASR